MGPVRGRTGVPGRVELCLPLLDFDVAARFVFYRTTYEKKDNQADETKKKAYDEPTYCIASLGVCNNCRDYREQKPNNNSAF